MITPTDRLTTALANRYRIERHLGEGGMATVYLAHDLKHERKVAVKVLRPELAAVLGADRFVQEIKTTAALQHPHILPLFDSGEANAFLYYVMPYVEGETLRDKLNRETQLGIDEAVRIAREVADALDYAHRHGVIHRDIKPENVLLHDGRPMVADFGIALAVSAAAGGRMTETGLSLGTPHYMSPEQATADKHVTSRSDVYSLGCVLYEMLAGEPPHTGASAQAIVMKIVTDPVRPVTDLRKTVPAHVAAAVATALEKLPADRFETARAFAEALANPAFATTGAATAAGLRSAGSPARRPAATVALAAVGVVAVALAAWGWLRPVSGPSEPVVRYRLPLTLEVGLGNDFGSNLALSPDGTRLVYASAVDGTPRLWMLERHQLESKPVSGTEQAHQPFFSPDGTRVAFVTWDRQLRIVSLGGEPPTTLVDTGIVRGGGAWGGDGFIYLAGGSSATGLATRGLMRVSALGGPIERVSEIDTSRNEVAHYFPTALPGDRGVAFVIHRVRQYDAQNAEIGVVDLRTGRHRTLLQGTAVRWSPTGHLIVVRQDGALVAAPFDPRRLELTGPATPLLNGVEVEDLATSDIDISATGTLVYQASGIRGASRDWEPVWVTRDGQARLIDSSWTGRLRFPALSPDGRQLAVVVSDAEQQIWIKQLDRGPLSRLTFEGRTNVRPHWHPDGRSVVFASDARTVLDAWIKRSDGSAQAELLLDIQAAIQEIEWSRDGAWVVLRLNSQPGSDLYAWRPGVDSAPTPLVATSFDELQPALSPDGRWLAYTSNESGRYEVYVRPFPDAAAAKWQVSTSGGSQPLWARSGRELFYKDGERRLVSAQVLPGGAFTLGERRVLFSVLGYGGGDGHRTYDITPDDQRFVMIRGLGSGEEATASVVVVDRFFRELQDKVRAR
jgi:eukaryotic-like serine/threonine-protein kinase